MTVQPNLAAALDATEALAVQIQDFVDQARIDLDGYTHGPIDPMEAPLWRVHNKLQEADLDMAIPWVNSEIQRLLP